MTYYPKPPSTPFRRPLYMPPSRTPTRPMPSVLPPTRPVPKLPARSYPWWYDLRPEDRLFTGRAYEIAKRLFDLTLLFVTLPVTLPLLLLCALLIKVESPNGPVLFVQMRTGRDGVRFPLYKFRTMVPDAEQLKMRLLHLNELQWPDFKIANDPRVTRVGRFLRKTSLDELPQLLNILDGDMSFVGPRPTSFPAETYKQWHRARLEVVPGLTGLWQITGRGCMEFDDRVRLDIAYIQRRSLWFDLIILWRTVWAVWQQQGVH